MSGQSDYTWTRWSPATSLSHPSQSQTADLFLIFLGIIHHANLFYKAKMCQILYSSACIVKVDPQGVDKIKETQCDSPKAVYLFVC